MEKIFIKYLNESKDLYRLEKATKGSAGFDLLASINDPLEINSGKILACSPTINNELKQELSNVIPFNKNLYT